MANQTDSMISGFKKKKEGLAKMKKTAGKPSVANAGLLKAGKSTLFNAIAGETVFTSDVIRATVKNAEKELEDYILLDTPGLDADEKDTLEAMAGYGNADIIIFVHNLQEGELNQTEIDGINQICGLFDSRDDFFSNSILVLTHKDQVEDTYMDICSSIQAQCEKILEGRFHHVSCVDSSNYLKGIEEGKELLKKDSGISELIGAINSCVSGGNSLRESGFLKKKNELVSEIEKAVSELTQTLPTEECSVTDIESAVGNARKTAEETIHELNSKSASFEKIHSYRYCGQAKNYKEYDSESSATSAGKTAINSAIEKAAKAVRKNALSHVETADSYINFSKVPKDMLGQLEDTYEKIRKDILKLGFTTKTNFTVALRDPSQKQSSWSSTELENAVKELSYVRSDAKNISTGYFSSASDYATRYSSNMYIETDYRDKWVTGLFGKQKCKTVSVYKYDVEGAIDDVASHAEEIEDDFRDRASEALGTAPRLIREDLGKQFQQVIDSIIVELNDEIKNRKQRQQKVQKEKSNIQKKINQLNEYLDEIRSM